MRSRSAKPANNHTTDYTRREALAFAGIGALAVAGASVMARAAAPAGQLTWGLHVSLAPTWFDPAETQGLITPVYGALRIARRDGETDAERALHALPRPVVDRVRRQSQL